jgi:hypothetical protein
MKSTLFLLSAERVEEAGLSEPEKLDSYEPMWTVLLAPKKFLRCVPFTATTTAPFPGYEVFVFPGADYIKKTFPFFGELDLSFLQIWSYLNTV